MGIGGKSGILVDGTDSASDSASEFQSCNDSAIDATARASPEAVRLGQMSFMDRHMFFSMVWLVAAVCVAMAWLIGVVVRYLGLDPNLNVAGQMVVGIGGACALFLFSVRRIQNIGWSPLFLVPLPIGAVVLLANSLFSIAAAIPPWLLAGFGIYGAVIYLLLMTWPASGTGNPTRTGSA